jgi:ADP-heptose:LPS heptosyltransferase
MSQDFPSFAKSAKTLLWKLAGGLFSESKSLPESGIDLSQIRSVLVIRIDRLGDVILSTPVYASIKRNLPDAKVTALVSASGKDILHDNPNVDQIIEWKTNKPWETLWQLRKEKFDLVFNLNKMFSGTFSMLTRFSRSKWRVGYDHPQNQWAHQLRVPPEDDNRHETENDLELLRATGFPDIVENPEVFFNAEENEKISSLIKENKNQPEQALILIKPGTRVQQWGWSPKKFQTITNQLMQSVTKNVFIITGPGEEELVESMVAGLDLKPFCLPKLTVKELALLIQRSDVLLCNHTGIMHLASATQTPVVAIFKHGNVKRWGPYHTRHVVLEERGSDDLSPETVLQAVEKLLPDEPTLNS